MNLLSFLRLKQFNCFLPQCFVCCILAAELLPSFPQGVNKHASTVTLTVDTTKPVNQFVPSHALGAGVDGHAFGKTERQLSPANIQAMLSAGFKPVTYRLRTELAGEAWH